VIEKFTTPEELTNLAPGLGVPTFSKNISFIAIAESHDSARAASSLSPRRNLKKTAVCRTRKLKNLDFSNSSSILL
jgi:hypothetical protein